MTSRFASLFGRSAAPGLLRWYGEPCVYYPRGITADARSIVAIVDRLPFESTTELGPASSVVLRIRANNSSIDGISLSEVDAGSDEIDVPLRAGDTELTRLRIVGQPELNAGLTRLRVQ